LARRNRTCAEVGGEIDGSVTILGGLVGLDEDKKKVLSPGIELGESKKKN
jgi:hypothetical protein